MPTKYRKTRKRPMWLVNWTKGLPKGRGKKYKRAGLTGKKTKTFGGQRYRRVSTHTRKIPHPHKRTATRYRRQVGLTAKEAAKATKGSTRIVKQRIWYHPEKSHILDDWYDTPVWSVYRENGN